MAMEDKKMEQLGDFNVQIGEISGGENIFNIFPSMSEHENAFLTMGPIWKAKSISLGRDDELSKIDAVLSSANLLIINGMAGIGKSELVKMYAEKYAEKYDIIKFASYSTSLVDLISSLSFTNFNDERFAFSQGKEALYSKKLELLTKQTNNVLLVIDNFSAADINKLNQLTGLNIRIIITTRDYVSGFNCLTIEKLAPTDASSLFCKLSGIKHNSRCDDLLEKVNCNTLMITLFASLISGSNGMIKISTILDSLDKLTMKDIKIELLHMSDVHRNDVKAYNTLFAHLETVLNLSQLSAEAKEIMMNMSLVPYEGMPYAEFLACCEYSDSDHINEISNLCRKSWISKDDTTNTVRLHPMISDFIFEEFAPDGKPINNMLEAIRKRLELSQSFLQSEVRRQFEFAKFIEPRLRGNDGVVQKLIINIAGLYYVESDFSHAFDLCHAVVQSESFASWKDCEKADMYRKMGICQFRMASKINEVRHVNPAIYDEEKSGLLGEAIMWFDSAYSVCENPLEKSRVLIDKINAVIAMEKNNEAGDLYVELVNILKNSDHENHPLRAIAGFYISLGEHDASLKEKQLLEALRFLDSNGDNEERYFLFSHLISKELKRIYEDAGNSVAKTIYEERCNKYLDSLVLEDIEIESLSDLFEE